MCLCNLLFIISVSFYTSGNNEVNNEDGTNSSTALLLFVFFLNCCCSFSVRIHARKSDNYNGLSTGILRAAKSGRLA